MSFRNIRVFYNHYARDNAGIAGITSNNAVETEFPLDHLIDDRQTRKMKFASVEADHFIDIDMGADFTGLTDFLIIPAGHSLDSVACVLRGDTTFPPTNSRASFTPGDSGIIKEAVSDSGTTKRYWRLEFGNGQHELHELILTLVKTLSFGFDMPDAPDNFRSAFTRLEQTSGITPTIKKGIQRRVATLPFRHALESTDLATAKDWAATSEMHRVFYVDTPSFSGTPDVDDPALAFKFEADPERAWGTAVPNKETEKFFYTFEIIQSVD